MKKNILIIFFYCQAVLAQDPYFINYGINEGFPTATIYSANQDDNGYLWFTTDVGIIKYDSHKFELFNTDKGLSDNEVFQMKKDYKGRYWLLTLNGKPSYIYNGKIYNDTNSVLLKKASGSSIIVDIYEDKNHNIYLSFRNGQISVIKPNNDVIIINSEMLSFNGIWKYKENLFYVCGNGVYDTLKKENIFFSKKTSTYKIYHSNFGEYISNFNTIYKIDEFNNLNKIFELPNKTDIINIYIENRTKLWICTRNGLFLIEDSLYKNAFYKDYSISSIIKDFEGGYWVTTLKNGLLYVPSFDVFRNKMGAKSNDKLKLNCISINNKKEIWVGGDNNNYFIKRLGQDFIKKTSSNSNRQDLIANIRFYNDEAYIVGKLGVVKIGNNEKKTEFLFSANDILINNKQMFIGYTYTYKIPFEKELNKKIDLINSQIFLHKRTNIFSSGKNNSTWIGTNYGLYQYNKKDSITYFGKKNLEFQTSIEDLYYDENSETLFVATASKGIITYKNNKIINIINLESGLNSNTCNSVKKISENYYLIGTNNGLNAINLNNNTIETQNLNPIIGLKNNKINDIDYLDNIVYLATDNGLLSFNLNNVVSKKTKPKCYILNLKNQNSVVTNDYVFPYYKSDISIEFNGISYINQGNLTYYYKLNSKKDDWSSSKESQINYKSLAPKKYSFSVYAVDGFGNKSAIKTINFEILPPFWQESWFIISSFIIIMFLLYSLIKYWLKKQQFRFDQEKSKIQMERDKANLEKQMIELEQKSLRLQMNPHFIFNALNTIKGYYSEGDSINASSYISKFSKLLRMLLENTEQSIALSKEIEMLDIYINLTKIRYKNKFEHKLIVDQNINSNETLIPTLLLQPIVENAIIHGLSPKNKKGLLAVSFLKKDNQLECIVEDDGIGRVASNEIQKNKEYQSKALEITKERLELFNNNVGESSIEIIDLNTNSIPSGTKVIITIPLITIW